MEADDLLCSRNARPEKALVGRAQWKINQPPSLKRKRASLEGSIQTCRKESRYIYFVRYSFFIILLDQYPNEGL
jgi:hypothetical protein